MNHNLPPVAIERLQSNLDPIRRFAWAFASRSHYGTNSYLKVGLFMAQLRHDLGPQVFARAERAYFQEMSQSQIAADLGIVEQTVKFHRARIMERMQARTTAELMLIAARLGIAGTATPADRGAPSPKLPQKGPRA